MPQRLTTQHPLRQDVDLRARTGGCVGCAEFVCLCGREVLVVPTLQNCFKYVSHHKLLRRKQEPNCLQRRGDYASGQTASDGRIAKCPRRQRCPLWREKNKPAKAGRRRKYANNSLSPKLRSSQVELSKKSSPIRPYVFRQTDYSLLSGDFASGDPPASS